MERPLSALASAEFPHTTTYLDTATPGVLPRAAVAQVRALAEAAGAGVAAGFGDFDRVDRVREAFARRSASPPAGWPPARPSPPTSA
ncbi:hypothetical protein AB0P15_25790 [Streptomyces sp. NPDC087917]|uniref:hypothetical protein n=1 Tax=Streptomyces sp. NPDC087917 TaxID=3155060 RepID=UPI003448AB41